MNFKINSPQKVRQFLNQEASKRLVFDAWWEVHTAPPNTVVGIKAVSRIAIGNATAEIKIYQLLDGQETPVEVKNVPIQNGKIQTDWRTKPVRAGNFEEGIYHFKVSVGGYFGETVTGLKLKDEITRRNESSFEIVKPIKPKVVF